MTTINDGGSAFPVVFSQREVPVPVVEYGMTLRDWFAGMALQIFISDIAGCVTALADNDESGNKQFIVSLTELSYLMADAMLRAREASNGTDKNTD